ENPVNVVFTGALTVIKKWTFTANCAFSCARNWRVVCVSDSPGASPLPGESLNAMPGAFKSIWMTLMFALWGPRPEPVIWSAGAGSAIESVMRVSPRYGVVMIGSAQTGAARIKRNAEMQKLVRNLRLRLGKGALAD